MGEIFGEFIVFVVLNFIGGTIRWCFASLFHFIFNTPKQPLKAYLFDSDSNKLIDDEGSGCINIVIGIAFVVLVAMVIYSIFIN